MFNAKFIIFNAKIIISRERLIFEACSPQNYDLLFFEGRIFIVH